MKKAIEKVLIIIYLITCCYIHLIINEKVNHEFIDEEFHVKQCQDYCNNNFFKWNNKITTPPGLYIIGWISAFLIDKVLHLKKNVCMELSFLRGINLTCGVILSSIVFLKIKKQLRKQSLPVINLISQPIEFTYYFFFYTDVWSTFFILVSFLYAIQKKIYLCILYGFLSFFMRQTNIIWLSFNVFMFLVLQMENKKNTRSLKNDCFQVLKQIYLDKIKLIPFFACLIFVLIIFCFNKGITFGDKENHQFSFHIVQIFYCFTLINFFTWPNWLSYQFVQKYIKQIFRNKLNFFIYILSLCFIKIIIDKFSIFHQFLISDNRHFTFYIYKRFLFSKKYQIGIVPLYHFFTFTTYSNLKNSNLVHNSHLFIIVFFFAIFLTIVPSPLFEIRYYIIPLILYRINLQPQTFLRSFLEFLWLNSINVFTMSVFLHHEFYWPNDPKVIQRIIW